MIQTGLADETPGKKSEQIETQNTKILSIDIRCGIFIIMQTIIIIQCIETLPKSEFFLGDFVGHRIRWYRVLIIGWSVVWIQGERKPSLWFALSLAYRWGKVKTSSPPRCQMSTHTGSPQLSRVVITHLSSVTMVTQLPTSIQRPLPSIFVLWCNCSSRIDFKTHQSTHAKQFGADEIMRSCMTWWGSQDIGWWSEGNYKIPLKKEPPAIVRAVWRDHV